MNAQAKPATITHDVRVEPWPGKPGEWVGRGRKTIIVDGEQWGSIHCEGHGCHGVHYWFKQTGEDGAIQEHVGTVALGPSKGEDRYREVKVWGDKQEARELGLHTWSTDAEKAKLKPVADRLQAKAEWLVVNGLLINPCTIAARQERARKAYDKRQAEEADLETKRFESKANAAIRAVIGLDAISTADRDVLKAGIVEAMKWAQTQ